MELLLQPNGWSCTPTAFAMVCNTEPREIIEYVGHDGSEVLFPEVDPPKCYRGFHIQEMLDYCIENMFHPVIIQALPVNMPRGADEDSAIIVEFSKWDDPAERIGHYLSCMRGVILGQTMDEKDHAVAWCPTERLVFDPRGQKYDVREFSIEFFIGIM